MASVRKLEQWRGGATAGSRVVGRALGLALACGLLLAPAAHAADTVRADITWDSGAVPNQPFFYVSDVGGNTDSVGVSQPEDHILSAFPNLVPGEFTYTDQQDPSERGFCYSIFVEDNPAPLDLDVVLTDPGGAERELDVQLRSDTNSGVGTDAYDWVWSPPGYPEQCGPHNAPPSDGGAAPPTGGGNTKPADTTPPTAILSTEKKKQKARKHVGIVISCGIDACLAEVDGVLEVVPSGGPKSSAAAAKKKKKYELKGTSVQVPANGTATATLKLPKKGLKAARKALKHKGKAKVKFTADVSDAAGNSTTATEKVKLKR